MSRTTTMDIRTASRFEVLRAIYSGEAATRQTLAACTEVSFATVSNVVAEMLAAGLLIEESYESSVSGRPRARLAVNSSRGRLAGVSIAETHLRIEMFDLALRRLTRVHRPFDLSRARVPELTAAITAGLAELGPPPLGVGVALYAHVTGGSTALFGGLQPGPGERGLQEALADALSVPVLVDNPLKAAAIAELWFGAGHGAHTLASITLGTGVGAGMTIRGKLLRGTSDSAGEWGHTTLIMDGAPCRCGSRGCVEAYVGAPAILRAWRPGVHYGPGGELAGVNELVAAMRRGEPEAAEVLALTGRYLGAGLANIINMINPDTVVLGGWITDRLGEWLLPAASTEAARRALRRPFDAARIVRSPISGHRTCLGMATFALEEYLTSAGLPSRQRTSTQQRSIP